MIFRQLYDSVSSTYTYLLADPDSGEALLLDPVFERHARDLALITELGLKLRATLETHVHADHVTGAWLMRAATGCAIGVSAVADAVGVDLPLVHGDIVRAGAVTLEVRAVPGHTNGCLAYVCHAAKLVFTGDALLIRGAGRTDFQQGDAARLYASIHAQIFSLADDYQVYPAHDYEGRTVSTVGEERRFNARIGGDARLEDFVGYMQNLALPHPKQIDVAVPANLRCGEPADACRQPPADWGPASWTYAGVLEIEPEWVASHRDALTLLDVRDPAEWDRELPALHDSVRLPLDSLRARAAELPSDKPIVTICQTGRRSALAVSILHKAGFERVANLSGGMLRWRGLGLPD